MTAAGATGRHHYTRPPRLIFIFTVGPVSRFPVVGRGRPTGDFEIRFSSRIESEVVGQSQAKLGWSLEAITTGKGTDAEETEEVGGKSSVEMVEVETARDEYEDMWVVPPKYIDSPADLIDDNDRTVFWRYRNGVSFGGDITVAGGYIRENWGDVPMRDWWDYVQPHEAGAPEPDFPPV